MEFITIRTLQIMKKFINSCLWLTAKLWSLIYSYSTTRRLSLLQNKLYTAWLSPEFKNIDKTTIIVFPIDLKGGKYISIGNESTVGRRTFLTAWDNYGIEHFQPQITIGNNVSIGEDCHITAINRIQIGNNVLLGKKITITDNSHGRSVFEELSTPPRDRPMYSRGPVIIEDGAWLGDKVSILPNVRIGKNAIIGANSVVTKDIPANCIAAGNPAKIIKEMKNE